MRTDTTPSFITELPLKTTSADESTTLVRLDTGRQLYNACLGESLNRLALNRQSKEFQEIQKLPKNNKTGLIFRNNTLYWSGLEIPCIVDKDNDLISYGLKHRVKYCRIVRRKINGRNRFYLQLILEGTPFPNSDNKIGSEEIGLDVGIGTIGIVGDTKAELKQFCSELIPDQKKKRKLQRKLDRSLRASNPGNYNENGTVKKGSKKWIKSNRYKTLSNELSETDRILAAYRKSLHGRDIYSKRLRL